MRGTDNVSGKVLSPARLKLVAVMAVLVGAALATRAWAQTPAPVVSDVVIHGCRITTPDQVKAHLRTRPGREYNPAIAQEDLNRLAETRWFRNFHVRLENASDGRVIVHFVVEEHPSVVREVIFKNAHHAKPDDLEAETGIRRGAPLSPSNNRRACHLIQEFYRRKGRLLCSVALEEGGNPGDQRVVFNITEGPVVRVRKVRFTGNDTLASGQRLKTQIDTRKPFLGVPWFGGKYNPAMVDNDAIELEKYYKKNGYLDAKVSREVVFNDDFRTVDVVFHIHEGHRYRVEDVTFEGTKVLDREQVAGVVRLKKGDVYNEPAVEADLRTIGDLYGYRGYPVLTERTLFYNPNESGVVRVHYQIVERGPDRVGTIEIEGNTVTKDRVIRRVLQIYPNEVLSYPHVRQSERDLARLNIFEVNPAEGIRPEIIVEDSPDPNNPYKNVRVRVKEQPTGSLMFGVGINSDSGLVGSIVLHERNFDILRPPTSLDDVFEGRAFRGGGQEFRLEAVPGTQLQRYTMSFREPYLFDRPLSLSVSGYYYDRIYNEYSEGRLGGRVGLGHQLNRCWSLTGGFRIENVDIRDVVPFAPSDFQEVLGNNFVFAPRVGVVRDDRDSFIRPTEGSIVEASYEQVLGDYTFPVLNAEASKYFTLWERPDGSGRHVLALRSQVAWAGDDAPVFERFYAGGFRSLRGFEFRGVGPNKDGFMVGGDFMFLASAEYQVPILANDQVYAVAFLDSGTVEEDVRISDYRVSAGFGLRFVVPMLGPVPIAIDFGFPIARAATDREQIFSFYVGLFR
jgi:outer membrane protein assembly complex protein YaeT